MIQRELQVVRLQYDFPGEWTSRVILKVISRNRRAPDPLPEWAYMIVYDLSDTASVNLSGTADNSPQAYLLGAFLFSIEETYNLNSKGE